MLTISESKVIDRKFILLTRYKPEFVWHELIPEIEMNYKQTDICPQIIIENFQNNKFAENSMYFHHDYAYADIPTGQEYDIIALIEKGKIQSDSVVQCKTKVLCFFTAYKVQPIEYANHGHHENCLIQFQGDIPSIIYELYEIVEKKPIEIKQEICLCSFDTLQANYEQYNLL